jgi:DNA-binding beta-propeller fold protein YncE
VYAYRVADIEGVSPAPVATFDKATYPFLNRPHYFGLRPGSNEIWLGNRPASAKGTVVRFNADTRTVVTIPTAALETTGIVGDEPNEIDFNKDGTLAYVGHHGHPTTGSAAASPHITIVDATTFTVKTNVPVSPGYETPGYVDTDHDKGFVYFCTKWGRAGPALAIMDILTERFMRYIDVGGFGTCYDVQTTPDKKFIFLGIGWSSLGPDWFGQGAVVAIDATTYTIAANIIDTDMHMLRSVHFAP